MDGRALSHDFTDNPGTIFKEFFKEFLDVFSEISTKTFDSLLPHFPLLEVCGVGAFLHPSSVFIPPRFQLASRLAAAAF